MHLRTIALAALAVCPTLVAQEPGDPPRDNEKPAQPERLTEWPSGDEAQKRRIVFLVKRLDAEDEETAAEAERELVALGDTTVRMLLRSYSEDKPALEEPIRRILDAVTDERHAALLAQLADDRNHYVRAWVMARLGEFGLEESRPVLAHAAKKDKDPEVVFRASLGLAGLGDTSVLPVLFDRCSEDWPQVGTDVTRILSRARSPEMAQAIAERMDPKRERTVTTGLRLMRGAAPESYRKVVGTYLDWRSHSVKKAAINTLRVIVDGDEPVEDLSVFDVIKIAKEWKARI